MKLLRNIFTVLILVCLQLGISDGQPELQPNTTVTARIRDLNVSHMRDALSRLNRSLRKTAQRDTRDTNPIFPVTVDLSKLMSMIETRFQTLEDNQSAMQTQIKQLQRDVAYAKSQIRDHATEITNLKHERQAWLRWEPSDAQGRQNQSLAGSGMRRLLRSRRWQVAVEIRNQTQPWSPTLAHGLPRRRTYTSRRPIWQGRQEADNEMPCSWKMSVHQPHAEKVLSIYLREKWGKMTRTNRKGKQTRMKTIKPWLFLQNDMVYD